MLLSDVEIQRSSWYITEKKADPIATFFCLYTLDRVTKERLRSPVLSPPWYYRSISGAFIAAFFFVPETRRNRAAAFFFFFERPVAGINKKELKLLTHESLQIKKSELPHNITFFPRPASDIEV
ncbi:MAG: hypothetical protein JW891_04300 [Candidatus Lokiarchaeota archaeon]|nr:hypothetical protein [Candidatus Lokiarchaeota archaeon]